MTREDLIKKVLEMESAAESYEEGVVVEAFRKDVIDLLNKYDQQG